MKSILYCLFVCAIVCSIPSCKPAEDELCVGILCQNGGNCQNGDCICINGFTGNRCQTSADSCANVNCGHGTCNGGQCKCDPNWTGTHCDQQIVPVDSFPGTYIMSGYTQQFDTANAPQVPFRDTIEVVKVNDVTLSLNFGYWFTYQTLNGSAENYNYLWLSGTSNNYAIMGFSKLMNDSLFYEAWNFDERIVLRGKKVD